jgi:hypothetical protein
VTNSRGINVRGCVSCEQRQKAGAGFHLCSNILNNEVCHLLIRMLVLWCLPSACMQVGRPLQQQVRQQQHL